MTKVCTKHKENPVMIYGECIGCEIEYMRAGQKSSQERADRAELWVTTLLSETEALKEELQLRFEAQVKNTAIFNKTIDGLEQEITERQKIAEEREEFIEILKQEVQQAQANHEDLKNRLAFLQQRPDLPVDRIPVYERLQATLHKLGEALLESHASYRYYYPDGTSERAGRHCECEGCNLAREVLK